MKMRLLSWQKLCCTEFRFPDGKQQTRNCVNRLTGEIIDEDEYKPLPITVVIAGPQRRTSAFNCYLWNNCPAAWI
jgi:hypothetical protein